LITRLAHALYEHWVEASGDAERLRARPTPDRTRHLGFHTPERSARAGLGLFSTPHLAGHARGRTGCAAVFRLPRRGAVAAARPGMRGRQCTGAPREWWWHAIDSLPARGRADFARDHGPRVPDQDTCLWRLTDDYTFEQLGPAKAAGHIIVIDFDDRLRRIVQCAAWAERWHGGHCFPD